MTNIRWAEIEDETACIRFYNLTYGRHRTPQQWRWGFVTPVGGGQLPYVTAFEEEELVGTQAYIPVSMVDEQGTFVTAKSEETLVSPSMRGKNLLNAMYEPIFARLREEGTASIWGFTPAEKAFRKLGFDIPMKTKLLFKGVSPDGLSSVASDHGDWKRAALFKAAGLVMASLSGILNLMPPSRLRSGEDIYEITSADDFSADYTHRFITSWGGCTIDRNSSYMSWRLLTNPYLKSEVLGVKVDGKLVAHIAFCVDDAFVGRVVDLISVHPSGHADDRRIASALLRRAVDVMRLRGAKSVLSLTVTNHPFDRLVREVATRLGFINLNRGSAVVFHTGLPHSKRGTSHDDFDAWYVTNLFTEGQLG